MRETALAQSGADMVMVGRAALGRPWLPARSRGILRPDAREGEPSLPTQLQIAADLYRGDASNITASKSGAVMRASISAAAIDVARRKRRRSADPKSRRCGTTC